MHWPITVPSKTLSAANQDVERSKQRRRAVALIVMRHRAGPALLQRQSRLGAIERLNMTLLIHSQNQSLVRRIEVQPDHVHQLFREARITGYLERPNLMRLQAMAPPNPLNAAVADADSLGQQPPAPVRRLRWRLCRRLGQNLLDNTGRQRLASQRSRLVAQKPSHALFHESPLPAPDRRL